MVLGGRTKYRNLSGKREALKFDLNIADLKQVRDAEVGAERQVKILKRTAALEKLKKYSLKKRSAKI